MVIQQEEKKMNAEKIIIKFLKNNGFSTEEIDDLINELSAENHTKETEQYIILDFRPMRSTLFHSPNVL